MLTFHVIPLFLVIASEVWNLKVCACAMILDSSLRSATFRMTECQHYLVNDRLDLIPAALYARLSSERQDVDLSVAAQLRVLRLVVYQCERYTAAYDNADTR